MRWQASPAIRRLEQHERPLGRRIEPPGQSLGVRPDAPAKALDAAALLDSSLRLARAVAGAMGEEGVARCIAVIFAELLDADQGSVGLLRDGGVVVVAALESRHEPVRSHFPVGFGVAGWVAATGQGIEIADVRNDRRYVPLPYPEVRSFLGVPLRADGELLGVISLGAWRAAAFPEGAAAALAPLAEHAALWMRRATAEASARLRMPAPSAVADVAVVLHELKVPLHSLIGFIDLLAAEQAGPLSDRQRDLIRAARDECGRLSARVGAVLSGEPPHLEPAAGPAKVDAAELARVAIERASGLALRRNVHLAWLDRGEQANVQVEPESLLEALGNVLENALRVAPERSTVEISTRRVEEGVEFVVADRGPGLPADRLETIFEPGSQGAGTEGDAGLGLALTRVLVEGHGGRIWAENRGGGGARFHLRLPLA